MSKIELFTPDFEKVITIESEDLQDYLVGTNSTYRKSKDGKVHIVFKKTLEPMLEAIEMGQIKLINNFDRAKKISENLLADQMLAFAAGNTLLRGCKTNEGVILAMENMAAKLIGNKRIICLPPGCYGERFLFVICGV